MNMLTRTKKWLISGVLGLGLVLSLAGFTYAAPPAQEGTTPEHRARIRGIVQEVGDQALTVQTLAGETVTVAWNDETVCVIRGRGDAGSQSACERIQVNDLVKAFGQRSGNTLNARRIAAFVPPEDLGRVRGTVQAVGDHSLTVLTPGGETVTVAWGDETRCVIRGRGAADTQSACERIQVGDHVRAIGQREGNTLNARRIVARVPQQPNPARSQAPTTTDK
jgi:hypothetical protein